MMGIGLSLFEMYRCFTSRGVGDNLFEFLLHIS